MNANMRPMCFSALSRWMLLRRAVAHMVIIDVNHDYMIRYFFP